MDIAAALPHPEGAEPFRIDAHDDRLSPATRATTGHDEGLGKEVNRGYQRDSDYKDDDGPQHRNRDAEKLLDIIGPVNGGRFIE